MTTLTGGVESYNQIPQDGNGFLLQIINQAIANATANNTNYPAPPTGGGGGGTIPTEGVQQTGRPAMQTLSEMLNLTGGVPQPGPIPQIPQFQPVPAPSINNAQAVPFNPGPVSDVTPINYADLVGQPLAFNPQPSQGGLPQQGQPQTAPQQQPVANLPPGVLPQQPPQQFAPPPNTTSPPQFDMSALAGKPIPAMPPFVPTDIEPDMTTQQLNAEIADVSRDIADLVQPTHKRGPYEYVTTPGRPAKPPQYSESGWEERPAQPAVKAKGGWGNGNWRAFLEGAAGTIAGGQIREEHMQQAKNEAVAFANYNRAVAQLEHAKHGLEVTLAQHRMSVEKQMRKEHADAWKAEHPHASLAQRSIARNEIQKVITGTKPNTQERYDQLASLRSMYDSTPGLEDIDLRPFMKLDNKSAELGYRLKDVMAETYSQNLNEKRDTEQTRKDKLESDAQTAANNATISGANASVAQEKAEAGVAGQKLRNLRDAVGYDLDTQKIPEAIKYAQALDNRIQQEHQSVLDQYDTFTKEWARTKSNAIANGANEDALLAIDREYNQAQNRIFGQRGDHSLPQSIEDIHAYEAAHPSIAKPVKPVGQSAAGLVQRLAPKPQRITKVTPPKPAPNYKLAVPPAPVVPGVAPQPGKQDYGLPPIYGQTPGQAPPDTPSATFVPAPPVAPRISGVPINQNGQLAAGTETNIAAGRGSPSEVLAIGMRARDIWRAAKAAGKPISQQEAYKLAQQKR